MTGDKKENKAVVLIVDDAPDTLRMLNDVLENTSMTTLVALEGEQAINIARKMTPDIILLDAIMPVMDGFETCRRLKSDPELKGIPVIFMTGLSDVDSIVKGFEVGGVDYLTKPVSPPELIARINVHLMNARTTLSVQTALDQVGQCTFAVDSAGRVMWSTPCANRFLLLVDEGGNSIRFREGLQAWLMHKPESGNRFHFENREQSLTMIYSSLSVNGEHLIRFIEDNEMDEASIIRKHFGVTRREAEVFLWLAKGKTNREIALILDMSPRTVNKHLEQLFKKLGVVNRTSAATMAIECLQQKRGY